MVWQLRYHFSQFDDYDRCLSLGFTHWRVRIESVGTALFC